MNWYPNADACVTDDARQTATSWRNSATPACRTWFQVTTSNSLASESSREVPGTLRRLRITPKGCTASVPVPLHLRSHPEDGAPRESAFPTDPPARYVAKLGVELPGVLVSVRMTAIIPRNGLAKRLTRPKIRSPPKYRNGAAAHRVSIQRPPDHASVMIV